MEAFLAFARGGRPSTVGARAAWRILEENFRREEVDLESVHLLDDSDLNDLVPEPCRAAFDAKVEESLRVLEAAADMKEPGFEPPRDRKFSAGNIDLAAYALATLLCDE